MDKISKKEIKEGLKAWERLLDWATYDVPLVDEDEEE